MSADRQQKPASVSRYSPCFILITAVKLVSLFGLVLPAAIIIFFM